MAYGLRLRIEYKDVNEVLTQINVYQDGYDGAADVRYANDGAKFSWGDQSGVPLPQVYGSSMTAYLDAEFDYEFLYLFTENARKHFVEVLKNSQVFWRGFVEPGTWSEPLVATPYPVSFTAYDGLGMLKDVDFADETGADYTGNKTLYELLDICLKKTGLTLPIHCGVDWYEETQVINNTLKATKYNCAMLAGKSCYEVLELLFPECRIFQRKGDWWLLANTQHASEMFGFFKEDGVNPSVAEVVNPALSGFWVENSGLMNVQQAVKKLNVKQDFGYVPNLVENGSFDQFEIAEGSPIYGSLELKGWTRNGVDIQSRTLNDDGDRYIWVLGRENPPQFQNLSSSIQKTLAVKASTDAVKFSVKFALAGGENSSGYMFMRVRLTGGGHTYYLSPEYRSVDNVLQLTWYEVTVDSVASIIPLKFHAEKDPSGLYFPMADPMSAWPPWKIADHFETFSGAANGIPVDGTLDVFLFRAYSDTMNVTGACYTAFTLSLLDENEENLPAKQTLTATISNSNNFVPDDLELISGTLPDNPNKLITYNGGLLREDDTATGLWNVVGAETSYQFAELIARIAATTQRTPREVYVIRLADVIPGMGMIIEDENNPGKKFIESGIDYYDRLQTVEGRYVEILSLDLSAVSIEYNVESTARSTSNGSSQTAKPQNNEHRVNVIDESGLFVSSPGYMNSGEFAGVTGPDGFTRIYLRALQTGILSGLASRHIEHEFDFPFDAAPVGRGSVNVYRVVTPEAGLTVDQRVLWKNFAFTTNSAGQVDGFALDIDDDESLAGVVVEFCFIKNQLI